MPACAAVDADSDPEVHPNLVVLRLSHPVKEF